MVYLKYLLIFIPVILVATKVPALVPEDNNSKLLKRDNKTGAYIFVFLVLTLAAALRYGVGTDYSNYQRMFRSFVNNGDVDFDLLSEPGFYILMKLSSWIYNDPITMFFIASVITVGLYVRTIHKYSSVFWFTITIFLFYAEWQHTFNGVRQYLAAAILFAGYKYLYDKNFKKYLIVTLVAMCFHVTGVFGIVIYLIASRKYNLRTLFILIIGAVAVWLSYDYLFSVADTYIDSFWVNDYVTNSMKWQRAAFSLLPIIIYYFIPPELRATRENDLLIILTVFNACLLFACLQSTYLERITYYTQIYVCMALPKFVSQLETKNKKVAIAMSLGLYFAFWILETGRPYYSIFNNPWKNYF